MSKILITQNLLLETSSTKEHSQFWDLSEFVKIIISAPDSITDSMYQEGEELIKKIRSSFYENVSNRFHII